MTNSLSWLDKLPRCPSCGERLHAGRHLLVEHNEHGCTRLHYSEKCVDRHELVVDVEKLRAEYIAFQRGRTK